MRTRLTHPAGFLRKTESTWENHDPKRRISRKTAVKYPEQYCRADKSKQAADHFPDVAAESPRTVFSATAQMPERSSKAEGKGFNRRIERQNTAPAIFLVVSLRMCLSDVPFIFYLFRLVRSS